MIKPGFVLLQAPGLNIITEYIIGYAYPDRPVANICFKTYGYISMSQSLTFRADLKLGAYIKIESRIFFVGGAYLKKYK